MWRVIIVCSSLVPLPASFLHTLLLPSAPFLSLSTDLLVVSTQEYPQRVPIDLQDGNLETEIPPMAASVSCTPSDPRAPVKWTNLSGGLPLDFNLLFIPSGLNHTMVIQGAPDRVETFFCDLIDTDNPDDPVNPQELTVRFISGNNVQVIIFDWTLQRCIY